MATPGPGSILLPNPCAQVLKEANIRPAVCCEIQSDLFVKPIKEKGKKKQKQDVVDEFVIVINTLLNKGQGLFCIHAKSAAFLDKFQEQVDDPLNRMITDGSLFADNFERTCHFEKDERTCHLENDERTCHLENDERTCHLENDERTCHLENDERTCHLEKEFRAVYRVKPRKRPTPPVNREYNTKVSLDKGLADLSHQQFVTFIDNVSASEQNAQQPSDDQNGTPSVSQTNKRFSFIDSLSDGQQVQHFTENHFLQAKGFPSKFHEKEYVSKNLDKLVKYIWEHLFKYISAFSKNKYGGSLFFGIKEEKEGNLCSKWLPVKENEIDGVEIKDNEWKLWTQPGLNFYAVSKIPPHIQGESPEHRQWEHISSNEVADVIKVTKGRKLWEDGKSSIYHVARETDVPLMSEISTGKFVCKAVPFSLEQRQRLEQKILQKVHNDLLWVGKQDPYDPVAVVFHKIESTDLYVIEFVVKYYCGIVFTSVGGPTSYTINTRVSPPSIDVMPAETWIRSQTKNDEFQIRKPVQGNAVN